MLISELITKLNEYINCNGDLEVVVVQRNGSDLTTNVDLLNCFTINGHLNPRSHRVATCYTTSFETPESIEYNNKQPNDNKNILIAGW